MRKPDSFIINKEKKQKKLSDHACGCTSRPQGEDERKGKKWKNSKISFGKRILSKMKIGLRHITADTFRTKPKRPTIEIGYHYYIILSD